MVTVRRDSAGRYFVSFSVEEPRREHAPAPRPIVGVDLGLKDLLTDSAGGVVKPYRALARRQAQLRRAQRTLSRRTRRSRRWYAQRRRVGRLHARVADARANFLHHVSRRLVNENQVIVTGSACAPPPPRASRAWSRNGSDTARSTPPPSTWTRATRKNGNWPGACGAEGAGACLPGNKYRKERDRRLKRKKLPRLDSQGHQRAKRRFTGSGVRRDAACR